MIQHMNSAMLKKVNNRSLSISFLRWLVNVRLSKQPDMNHTFDSSFVSAGRATVCTANCMPNLQKRPNIPC